MKTVPNLYLVRQPKVSACLIGWGTPKIMVSTGATEKLTQAQFDALVGHELGHFFAGHYYQRLAFLVLGILSLSVSAWFGSWAFLLAACVAVAMLNYSMKLGQELQADQFAARVYGREHMLAVLHAMAKDYPKLAGQLQYKVRVRCIGGVA